MYTVRCRQTLRIHWLSYPYAEIHAAPFRRWEEETSRPERFRYVLCEALVVWPWVVMRVAGSSHASEKTMTTRGGELEEE